ncbi:hypothetical protein [Actinospica sp.]|uniref:hypothetical protein n=1 Tax=Actinospica sp. TaxID=1872142 RepID=UPI002D12F4B4|nr:hypothetical protein [Actinospica sp.]HWG25856.1 hypothetical protein [Actinospica sp.]
MSLSRRSSAIAASAVLAASSILGLGASPASAASVTPSCAADAVLGITSATYHFMWDNATWFHDGPGGSVTGTVQTQRTISATISAGAEVSTDELVVAAKATVSSSATKSLVTTLGHTYTHTIPAADYGNLKYGGWGYSVSWTYEYRQSNCVIKVLQKGTGQVPTVAQGWYYYNTTS